MKQKGLSGLSDRTAGILEAAGLTTRRKVASAGEVAWLKLPMFGRERMAEVTLWLGDESPAARREIARCIKFLKSHGYTVMKPNS